MHTNISHSLYAFKKQFYIFESITNCIVNDFKHKKNTTNVQNLSKRMNDLFLIYLPY